MTRHIYTVALALLALTSGCRPHLPPDPLPGFPRLVVWAWERPENLSYIVPTATGIAYLAGTIALADSGPLVQPRSQPLILPPHTPLIAVIRLESRTRKLPASDNIARQILSLIKSAQIRALQIDFDARASERSWYRDLLDHLRHIAPSNLPVEITALVSWCEGDHWLRGLPIVDAVPMFFRMGVDPHSTHEYLREPLCRCSIGISTDEFYVTVPTVRRVFVFGHQPWTESSYRAVLQASKQWFPGR
jgi:hypothetical protein